MAIHTTGDDLESRLDGPRGLRPEEHAAALRLINLAFRPDAPGTMEIEFSHIIGETNIDNMRVIVDGDKVVSHVAIYFSTLRSGNLVFKVGGISGVATHPDYRNRGLASAVMRDCLRIIRERGCHISFLWTDRHDFYRSFGYESAGSFCIFKLPASEAPGAASACEIVPYTPQHLAKIMEIHERETLRTERTVKDCERYFAFPRIEALSAIRDGKVTAYGVMSRGQDLPGFMVDWGGDPRDLMCLARELASRGGLEDAYILAPTSENRFTDFLISIGAPQEFMKLVMLSVIDVDGLSSVVSEYVSDRLGTDFRIAQDSEGVKLTVGSEEQYVEPARLLACVLFGPEPPSTFLNGFSDDTVRALDKALPIPLFVWGLDWV